MLRLMLREIIRPTSEFYKIQIPKEYLNCEVEILVLPFSNNSQGSMNESENIFSKTSGILKSKNIDPLKWQEDIRNTERFDKYLVDSNLIIYHLNGEYKATLCDEIVESVAKKDNDEDDLR